jgi:hypothetical protein
VQALNEAGSFVALIQGVLEVTIPWPKAYMDSLWPGGAEPMRKMPWVMYLWPGLPQLWLYGAWTGLVTAVSAATILDLLLLSSFGWSDLIASKLRTVLWLVFGLLWTVAAVWSARWCRKWQAVTNNKAGTDVFSEIWTYYLRGDYFQAEHLLAALLQVNTRDLDARLLLATLMRHTGRMDEASQQLDILERFEGVAKWQLEIEHERKLLAEAKNQQPRVEEPAETSEEPLNQPAHAA